MKITGYRRHLHRQVDRSSAPARIAANGLAGTGFFPVPTVFERQLRKQDKLKRIGATEELKLQFDAISGERKIKHPAVVAICNTARRDLFGAQ